MFFFKTRCQLSIQSFFESSKAWTNEDQTVDYHKEMEFILRNDKDWQIMLQSPGDVMEHCGAYLHAACTIVQKSNPVCVSIGFQTSTATTPVEQKKWATAVAQNVGVSGKEVECMKRQRDASKEKRESTKKARRKKQGKNGRFLKPTSQEYT